MLGDRHRLLCGDARSADYGRLMRGEQAAMVFTDPPYNVPIPKTVGRGRVKHRNFAMAAGEMSPAVFTAFLNRFALPGGRGFGRWRLAVHLHGLASYARDAGCRSERSTANSQNLVVWTKTNAGQGSFYRSQHELIFVYKVGAGPHINNVELGRHGRNRSNVWTYPGGNTFRAGRMADLAAHPTVKPVALICDAIRDCSRRGDIVLDPFMGVGTTILAAERIGRRAYGIEIDPLYVDAAIRRWQAVTKRDAVLEATGKTFDEIATGTTPHPEGQMNRPSEEAAIAAKAHARTTVFGSGSSAKAVQLANSVAPAREKPAERASEAGDPSSRRAKRAWSLRGRAGRRPAAVEPHY